MEQGVTITKMGMYILEAGFKIRGMVKELLDGKMGISISEGM